MYKLQAINKLKPKPRHMAVPDYRSEIVAIATQVENSMTVHVKISLLSHGVFF